MISSPCRTTETKTCQILFIDEMLQSNMLWVTNKILLFSLMLLLQMYTFLYFFLSLRISPTYDHPCELQKYSLSKTLNCRKSWYTLRQRGKTTTNRTRSINSTVDRTQLMCTVITYSTFEMARVFEMTIFIRIIIVYFIDRFEMAPHFNRNWASKFLIGVLIVLMNVSIFFIFTSFQQIQKLSSRRTIFC